MTRKTILIVISIAVGLLMLLSLIIFIIIRTISQAPKPGIPETTTSVFVTTTTPKVERREVCPLTGELVASRPDSTPVAACIDNIRQARPQSGLNRADIVYDEIDERSTPP